MRWNMNRRMDILGEHAAQGAAQRHPFKTVNRLHGVSDTASRFFNRKRGGFVTAATGLRVGFCVAHKLR